MTKDEIEEEVMRKVEAMMPMLKLVARGKQAGVEYRFDENGDFIELVIPDLKKEDLS